MQKMRAIMKRTIITVVGKEMCIRDRHRRDHGSSTGTFRRYGYTDRYL